MEKILKMIEEFEKGCSCAGPYYDKMIKNKENTSKPEECLECTRGLINSIKKYCKRIEEEF